jgi:hypothetical protein
LTARVLKDPETTMRTEMKILKGLTPHQVDSESGESSMTRPALDTARATDRFYYLLADRSVEYTVAQTMSASDITACTHRQEKRKEESISI